MMESILDGVLARRPRALARAITLLESNPGERRKLVSELYSRTGKARVVGITGPPGAGKSTLVDRLARDRRAAGFSVAILAVDPSSPFSGGALLGDRVRMQTLYTDPEVFIRSMATRGTLGGLAATTRDAVDLLDAAGFDWILVETVGVGQDEIDVVRTVDTVVVVTLPGMGDEIQAIKAGIMEIADVFAINKADRPGVDTTLRDLESMLSMASDLDWRPPIVKTVASSGVGTEELVDKIEEHFGWLTDTEGLSVRRFRQFRLRVENDLEQRILAAAGHAVDLERELEQAFQQQRDPYSVGDRIFDLALSDRVSRRASSSPVDATVVSSMEAACAIEGVDHIAVAVQSIEQARVFYERLGLEVEEIEEVPQEGVRVAMIPCGTVRIELLEPTAESSPVARFLERRGAGLHHLCLATSDVESDDRRLRDAGIEMLRPAPTRGAGESLVQFVHPRSAGGVLVELAQQQESSRESAGTSPESDGPQVATNKLPDGEP